MAWAQAGGKDTGDRVNIVENKAVVHGAPDFAELERLGLSPTEILDFSVNSNPYGPSPLARAALGEVNIERYPDRECLKLRRTILEYDLPGTGLDMENLLCGNGTAELIWATARAGVPPGGKAVIVGPTFGEYRQASLVAGAEIFEFRANLSNGFRPDVPALLDRLETIRPDVLWLCNPNNPTGHLLGEAELRQIFEYCRLNGIILAVDEAYQRFATASKPFSALNLLKGNTDGVVVLRSLTKDYGLAGLRLGYVAASQSLIDKIARQLPAWNVNAAAQTVGVAVLQDQLYLARSLAALERERTAFFAGLSESGLEMTPSATQFCLLKVGDGKRVRQKLLQKKILVRDGTSFGLPAYIRVATRPEWPQLIKELKEILGI